MLEVSRELNPECEHICGDMREVRLGRQFGAVFVHDAVMYMTTERDLQKTIETAYVYCVPGGSQYTKYSSLEMVHCFVRLMT